MSNDQQIQLQPDFKLAQFMGTWHEILRTKNVPWEKYDCVEEGYALNPDNSVAVRTTQFNPKKNKIEKITATARFNGPQGEVKFFCLLPAGDYKLISTDYTSYAVIYSLTRILFWKTEAAWIFTRERNPSEELVMKALGLLQAQVPHYKLEDFHRTTHSDDSKYLPPFNGKN